MTILRLPRVKLPHNSEYIVQNRQTRALTGARFSFFAIWLFGSVLGFRRHGDGVEAAIDEMHLAGHAR